MPTAAPEIRDIKPLVAIPHGLSTGAVAMIVIALLVVLGVAAWWWWRRHRKPSDTPGVVVALEAPEVVARRALLHLYAELDAAKMTMQRYFFGVSEILRVYIEARFGLNATDLTTSEIREQIESSGVPAAPRREVLALLLQADAIKFARAEATRSDCDDVQRRARAFIDATTQLLPPPVSSSPAASTLGTTSARSADGL